MNMKERLYCDYNATAPVASNVKNYIKDNIDTFGNPSSIHSTGKKARRLVNETRSYLYKVFCLKENEFELFFHSGATEGVNTVVKYWAFECLKKKCSFHFICAQSDHSSVVKQINFLNDLGFKVTVIEQDNQAQLNLSQLEEVLANDTSDKCLVNWTWVNNETGVINELETIGALKSKYKFMTYVDAVQAPGKIKDWDQLNKDLDYYTFSAHKFGALKGVGFSFVKSEALNELSLIHGGAQQKSIRSGTENSLAIGSIKVALEQLEKTYNYSMQMKAKTLFENKMSELMEDNIEIVAKNSLRNANTTYMIIKDIKAQTSSMALDMAAIDVSNGSACSSGAVIASRTLLAMGYSEKDSMSAIRFSFGSDFNEDKAHEAYERISQVLVRFKK